MADEMRFGEFFRNRRIGLEKTLRQFCLKNDLDPGNLSRLERGALPPPEGERLEEYARMLGLEDDTEERRQFFALANAEADRPPSDLPASENVFNKVPVLLRTVDGHRLSGQQIDDLLEMLRGA